ncbi:MAG: carbamoylphosphate synthase large subunit [Candidatus Woesearchaeota archaeon]|jgi:carbamoylphosphate synthase large subunit
MTYFFMARPYIQKPNILLLRPYAGAKVPLTVGLAAEGNLHQYNFNERSRTEPASTRGLFLNSYSSTVSADINNPHVVDVQHHRDAISRIIKEKKIDLVVPVEDKYANFLADAPFADKAYGPSASVFRLLRDKGKTYKFMRKQGFAFTPKSVTTHSSRVAEVENFLGEHGSCFVKASTACGGKYAGLVTSVDMYRAAFSDIPPQDLVISEILKFPEKIHTMLVDNGKAVVHVNYRSTSEAVVGASFHNVMTDDRELVAASDALLQELAGVYGGKNINGVFTIDFMYNDHGTAVMNDINVGRFPHGLGIILEAGLPLVKQFVDLHLTGEHPVDLSYIVGHERKEDNSVPRSPLKSVVEVEPLRVPDTFRRGIPVRSLENRLQSA